MQESCSCFFSKKRTLIIEKVKKLDMKANDIIITMESILR